PPSTAPIEATTEFELDTAIDGPPLSTEALPTEPLPAEAAPLEPAPPADEDRLNLTLAVQPQRWQPEPPEAPDSANLPETDEADALDSRYLLPSPRERKPAYLRKKGPEFADAQFPSDALLDEDPWEEPTPSPTLAHTPMPPIAAAKAPAASLQADAPRPEATPSGLDEGIPTTQPSRFGEDFVPETAVEPPSQRKGKPGTRAAQPTPEFMKRAQRQAFWRHPAVRAVLSLVALSLVLTLSLQMAHQFRDLLAAYHPPLRPYLAQWCQTVGCTLQAPLRLEALQVESATLVRATSDGPDRYRLAVVVHNKAPIELAWPHVDLTLTDANGAVIARRAFSPSDAEWLDSADVKADAPQRPSGAASIPVAVPSVRSTTLLWQLRAPSLQPAGYTAELFYP
ncbi:DUF3426 domain-containing protein, partial [Aquabacterium sp.]|uniref:DUF3426 domain-containing protein n=1 Tax=Aquabacterium sp. TaxID=1872578 RepID=UPI0025BE5647